MKRLIKNESGSTIIEVVVVMSIMAILATVTLSLVTSLFDSSIRTSKYLEQNTKIETLYGFFASRMASTNVGNVGLIKEADATAVDPLTLAGDQFIFTSNGGGSTTGATLCYRVMYFGENGLNNGLAKFNAKSIYVAVANNCATIRPTAGPNQTSSAISSSNDPVLDPASGGPAGSPFVLASNIEPTNTLFSTPGGPNLCGGSGTDKTYTSPLVPFAFCNETLSPLKVAANAAPIDLSSPAAAGLDYTEPDKEGSDILSEIRANQVTAYVQSGGESSSVPIRAYTQVFSLAQVCAVETEVDLTLPNPDNWRSIKPTGQADVNPAFNSGWEASTSGAAPGFYRDSATKRVYFRGAIRRSAGNGVGTTIFTLPNSETKKYVPEGVQYFTVPRGTSSTFGYATIKIETSGAVSLVNVSDTSSGANSYPIFLDSISFRVPVPPV